MTDRNVPEVGLNSGETERMRTTVNQTPVTLSLSHWIAHVSATHTLNALGFTPKMACALIGVKVNCKTWHTGNPGDMTAMSSGRWKISIT